MKLDNPPRAIFAHDDDMALAAREVILNMGLSIPEDVVLMGIDDIEMGALTEEVVIRKRCGFAKNSYKR